MTKGEHRWWRRKRDQKEFNKILNADDSDVPGWLCICGHWQDDDFHCSVCGGEPPWGCPCDMCQSAGWDDEFDGYDPNWGGYGEPEYDPDSVGPDDQYEQEREYNPDDDDIFIAEIHDGKNNPSH